MDAARRAVERIGRVSDDVIRLGPLKLGWDALLEFIPGVGEVYSLGAGAWLMHAARRAHLPAGELAKVVALVGANTAMGAFNVVPVAGLAGSLLAGLFRGHRYAAKALLKAIDQTHYVEGERTPQREREAEAARSLGGAKRVVFLGE